MFSRENFLPHLRNIHWLATRLLIQEMIKVPGRTDQLRLFKDSNGKPYLSDSRFDITLSHSGDFAAVLISHGPAVGIDIEKISPRIEKIAHKFVNETELGWIEGENPLSDYFRIWCAKEALFKLFGKGELDFRTNMTLKKLDSSWLIEIKKGDYHRSFEAFFALPSTDYLLCWLVE